MRKLAWFFLLIGSFQFWAHAQSSTVGMATGEKQSEVSAALPRPLTLPTLSPAGAVRHPQVFACIGAVPLKTCQEEMLVLKNLLNKYGADQLGQWKWVLVPSQQWKILVTQLGVSPNVPAFTALDAKMTLFDDALLGGSPGRTSQLMDIWGLGREELLDLAVRHELSHALCNDENESHVRGNAQLLDEKKSPICDAPPKKSNRGQRLRCH